MQYHLERVQDVKTNNVEQVVRELCSTSLKELQLLQGGEHMWMVDGMAACSRLPTSHHIHNALPCSHTPYAMPCRLATLRFDRSTCSKYAR
jgi:hypothetical protein